MNFIVFFGTRQVTRDDREGFPQTGQCPACRAVVTLRPRQSRTYVHVFWIPLIPLSKPQHFLECPQCKTRFINPAQR